MRELIIDEYYRVLPLLEPIEYDTVFARAVIEKKQSGKIYVNNISNPTVVLVSHYCGMALLCGSDDNGDFNKQLIDMLFKKSNNGPKSLKMIVYPETWERKLELLLGNRLVYYSDLEADKNFILEEKEEKLEFLSLDHIIGWTRIKFHFNKSFFESNVKRKDIIPKGFILKKIDEKILDKLTGKIIPSFSWDSFDAFLKIGVGFCLLKGEEIVCVSFAAFIANNMIDIGIETNKDYRGRGFGILAGAAMIEYCLENGIEPIWGCRKDNLASLRLARKLGFEEKVCHPTYWSIK